MEVLTNLCPSTPLRGSPGGTGTHTPKSERKIQRDGNPPSTPSLPRHGSNAAYPPPSQINNLLSPPPHHCYFGSRVTAEGLADLDTQSSCPGPRPTGDIQKCPSGGRREEEGEMFLPLFPLATTPLPLPSVENVLALQKDPWTCYLTLVEVDCFFVPLCTSSVVPPRLYGVAIFSLCLPSDWELPEDGLCSSPTRLKSSPTARAGATWEFPETKNCAP